MGIDESRQRELLTRIAQASGRIQALQAEVSSGGNVIHFRMERHVQSARELLHELNHRAIDMPAAHTYERRLLERRLRALESEIEFAESKLEAARAEEHQDLRTGAAATVRAFRAQMSVLGSLVGRRSAREGATTGEPPEDG